MADMGVQVHEAEIGADVGALLVTAPGQKIVIVDVGISARERTALLAQFLDDEEFAEVAQLSA